MTAVDDEVRSPRSTWIAVLGLVLLFAVWAVFAWQGVLFTQWLWATLPNDFGASVTTALYTSITWVVLLGTFLLLLGALRSNGLRVLDGALGLAVGGVGIFAALSIAATEAAANSPAQTDRMLEWFAASAAVVGGVLLLTAPLLQRHRAPRPTPLRRA
ncbi:hypothetical protein [Agrococcus beijingensis]|uniref:hypothetical protein n=1 Tax=Agrococcus beijingensis TaxID=3068634 RepID=UPI0027428731|nr:hypothetical protein [Agrococcus sp. REN33]